MIDRPEFLLAHYPVLASIPKADLETALRSAQRVQFKAGRVLFEELQRCEAFPFVLSGDLRVLTSFPA